MLIANPTYDAIFKYLMEDMRIAKGLISRIIEEEIIELSHAPQEETQLKLKLNLESIGVNHQDYVAIIKKENGEHEKIAIEVQKSTIQPKIDAFRNYVAEKYRKYSTIDGKEIYLPLKTIYIIEKTFNKNLPPILKVGRDYINVLTKKKYEGAKDKFVSLMTHEAFFIQTKLVPPDLENEITRVLNFFTRMFAIDIPKDKNISGTQKRKLARELDIPDEIIDQIDDKLFQRILTRLFAGNADRQVQLNVELSQKWQDSFNNEQEEKDKIIARNMQALEQKDQALEQNKQALEQKDQALEQNKQTIIKSAKAMLKTGMNIEQVMEITNLPKEEIENL